MSKGAKRFEAMKRNPVNDWGIGDVAVVCREFGCVCDPPSHGSHYTVWHPDSDAILPIPANRPIKRVYIKALISYIEALNRR